MKRLKYKSDFFIASNGKGFIRKNCSIFTCKKVCSACWPIKKSENVKQRRFSRTAWPHNRNKFTFFNGKRNSMKDSSYNTFFAVYFLYIVYDDKRHECYGVTMVSPSATPEVTSTNPSDPVSPVVISIS